MIRWSYVEVRVITLLTASLAIVSSAAPWYSGGYSIAPTPTMQPWPAISRGTECWVPIVPGLVRLIVVPWKSGSASLLSRARRTMSSYAIQNSAKFISSAALIDGTSSCRVPSGFCMSMARPRLMCCGFTRFGLPSISAYDAFISGSVFSALTSAHPIRCVNETLPPRALFRWLLITIRLSISSLTGTCRTLVAVGTWRLLSMFCTVRAGAPRRIMVSASPLVSGAAFGFAVGGWFTVPPVGVRPSDLGALFAAGVVGIGVVCAVEVGAAAGWAGCCFCCGASGWAPGWVAGRAPAWGPAWVAGRDCC